MNKTKKYEASATSLIDLKAELYRKQEAFRKQKLNKELGAKPPPTQTKLDSNLKADKWKTKNAGVEKRNAKDLTEDIDKDASIEKARAVLERKAKLYEYLSKGKTIEGNEDGGLFLVDFQKKALDEDLVQSSENASQMASQREFSHDEVYAAMHPESKDHAEDNAEVQRQSPSPPPSRDFNGPIHYQNVQFEEVREHGVGYYAFSQDEEERKKQMENLQRMREQTLKQAAEREKVKARRKAMLKARLDKVRQRKNIEKDEESEDSSAPEDISEIDPSEIPLPSEEPPEDIAPKRPISTRPWDKGKIMDPIHRPPPPKFKKMSQETWVEKKRQEREAEFAPPSFYSAASSAPKWKKPKVSQPWTDNNTSTKETESNNFEDTIDEALAYFRKKSDGSSAT